MNFSVVLIAKNESKTLPNLVKSLAEFQRRGGEIVLMDTGSTDGTPDVARSLGCVVHEVGDKFLHTVSESDAEVINSKFVAEGEPLIIKAGDRYFDYASARNYAATLAKCDIIATPDCDEMYTVFDLDKIESAISSGTEQFEYHFVFSHFPDGSPQIEFMHSKFYDRRKMSWVGVIHEVLHGQSKRSTVDYIRLEHWQQPDERRLRYLTGLAVEVFRDQQNDRNSHYFGRELMYSERPKSAIRELQRHVAMNRWPAEVGQSHVFIGDCHLKLGEEQKAVESYLKAILVDASRREAFMRLAWYYYGKGNYTGTATWAGAAIGIQQNHYYGNNAADYGAFPHEMLYWAHWYLGDVTMSKFHHAKAIALQPENPKYISDWFLFNDSPLVSIIIPTLGREDRLKKLVESIPQLAGYRNIEIVVEHDDINNRQGVAATLDKGINRARGEYILFLGNDCEPEPFFVAQAMIVANNQPVFVALNDKMWHGRLATHWMAHKSIKAKVGGKFFSDAYNHVGCDNELTARVKQLGLYRYAPLSKINHPAVMDQVREIAWDEKSVSSDRQLLEKRALEHGFHPFLP